jgi:hypothetical protein
MPLIISQTFTWPHLFDELTSSSALGKEQFLVPSYRILNKAGVGKFLGRGPF